MKFNFIVWVWCFICFGFLVLYCGSRPAGELLFCQQPQKSNQKKAAHFVCPAGSWILGCYLRARPDAPSRRTGLNSPSLANLLYQHPRIQQTKEGVKNKKKLNPITQNKSLVLTQALECSIVVDFELVHLSKPLNRGCCGGLIQNTSCVLPLLQPSMVSALWVV